MHRDEIFKLAAEKAVKENSWETIEEIFKPSNGFALMLRIDFEGMRDKAHEWYVDDSPTAMPHRFRGEYWNQLDTAIKFEEFYRKIKEIHEKTCSMI